jgi:hypothetical protein
MNGHVLPHDRRDCHLTADFLMPRVSAEVATFREQ